MRGGNAPWGVPISNAARQHNKDIKISLCHLQLSPVPVDLFNNVNGKPSNPEGTEYFGFRNGGEAEHSRPRDLLILML